MSVIRTKVTDADYGLEGLDVCSDATLATWLESILSDMDGNVLEVGMMVEVEGQSGLHEVEWIDTEQYRVGGMSRNGNLWVAFANQVVVV